MTGLRSYGLVTAAYWGFTLTDGALRMLVVLHFQRLGYDPVSIAFLFLFYEFFGIVTNLLGGWIASRSGVKVTLYGGLVLQIVALVMLALLNPHWPKLLSVSYVMVAQALSGIAKDLTKMSAKTAIRALVPVEAEEGKLFRLVSRLTGSKNALKGVGFFVGGALLQTLGYTSALMAMAAGLLVVLLCTAAALPAGIARSRKQAKFTAMFSKSPAINWLSAARVFLFASRDVWFVVALPVFLSRLGWTAPSVGAFLAIWVIGYGVIQTMVPEILRLAGWSTVDASVSRVWIFLLAGVPAVLSVAVRAGGNPALVLMVGLAVFGVIFAVNSALHSYLVLAYSSEDSLALDVGFYYMANAGGRLMGTLASGFVFLGAGFAGCLWASSVLVLVAGLLSLGLPDQRPVAVGRAEAGSE